MAEVALSFFDDAAPLLFIHGIKGSHLRDATGRRWIGPRQALGLDRRPLMAPLIWSGRQADDGMRPDGPVENVLWVTIYRPFLDRARRRHETILLFSYDWRREIAEAAGDLTRRLEAIAAEYGRPARIVAHSMGGLVTLSVLRQRPELCCGVLFAGTPFGTGIGFARDTHVGVVTGLNRPLLGPAAASSWSAHWLFFPTGPDSGLVDGDRALEHDWYDPSSWEHHRLGVFAAGAVDDVGPYRAHLTEAMTRARRLRREIEDPGRLAGSGLPIAILRSSQHDTPDTVVRNGPRAVRGWDVETVAHVPGDGRVKTASTEPPGVDFETFETARAHESLLDDHGQVEAALAWLAR